LVAPIGMSISNPYRDMKQKTLEWPVAFRNLSAVCFLLFAFASACAQEKPLEAWWLTTKYTASHTSYNGIDMAAIDSSWAKMTVLSYELLPEESKSDHSWMRKDGFVFVKEGQLSHKGLVEHVAVGVYEDRSGNGGRFLLVLRKDTANAWKKIFLHQEAGDPGFGVLVSKAGNLYWGTCMLCENFRKLTIGASGASLD